MHFQFPFILASVKAIACLLIAIGLGWTFAEVRRFVLHTGDFCAEAGDDRSESRTVSRICGAVHPWTYRACEYWWGVPPITCEERPFPHVASNLISIALAFFFLIA